MRLIGQEVGVIMKKNAGSGDIYGAIVVDEDDIGVTVDYVYSGTPRKAFIPWSAIGRLAIDEKETSA